LGHPAAPPPEDTSDPDKDTRKYSLSSAEPEVQLESLQDNNLCSLQGMKVILQLPCRYVEHRLSDDTLTLPPPAILRRGRGGWHRRSYPCLPGPLLGRKKLSRHTIAERIASLLLWEWGFYICTTSKGGQSSDLPSYRYRYRSSDCIDRSFWWISIPKKSLHRFKMKIYKRYNRFIT
jgi:hypothetical protein